MSWILILRAGVLMGLSRKLESNNLSRENIIREIGRSTCWALPPQRRPRPAARDGPSRPKYNIVYCIS